MLNVHRLAILHAVVAEGSITGAAAELSYTPSAVSQHIAALERETGAPLLERVGRRVRPTPAGTLLATHAGDILDRVAETEAALSALVEGRTGRIRVASFGSAGTGLVPPAVARFRERHPAVELNLMLAEQLDALAALRADRVDLAIVILDLEEDGLAPEPVPDDGALRWRPLLRDPYFVVLPRQHPLAARAEVELGQLADESLVSGERNSACPCGELLRRACAAAGFTPRFAVEVDDYPSVQSLVAAGLGSALIPLLGLSPAVHEGVTIRPLVGPALTRRVFAVTRAGRGGDPLIGAMLAGLRDATEAFVVPDAVPARALPAPVTDELAA